MTDEDIMLRVANLFEQVTGMTCNVIEEDRKEKNCQYTFRIVLYGARARIVMRTIVKRMGYRRRKKIHQALNGHNVLKVKFEHPGIVDPPNVIQIKRRA